MEINARSPDYGILESFGSTPSWIKNGNPADLKQTYQRIQQAWPNAGKNTRDDLAKYAQMIKNKLGENAP